MLQPHQLTVAVTGASGYIASEIVAQLLSRGYTVHGTVRRPPSQSTTGHLTALPGADRQLKLFEADLLNSKSFDTAFAGCQVVIHTASPVSADPNQPPEIAYVEPAVNGTKNVLNAIARSPQVKKVVLTSSIAAISSNAGLLPENHVYSDQDWSPVDRLKELGRWYAVGKTLAEKVAWEHELVTSKKVKLVVVNPGFVIGAISNPKHAEGTPKKMARSVKR